MIAEDWLAARVLGASYAEANDKETTNALLDR